VAHAWSLAARWRLVACAKLVGTGAATSVPLFLVEVIDDVAWPIALARPLSRSCLPCGRRFVGRLHRRSARFGGEGGSEVRAYQREREELVLGS
jgi:hypothetical protein